MPKQHMQDVIVVLPGICGSVLQRDGRDVWSVSKGGVLNMLRTLGGSLQSLELPHDDPQAEVAPDGVVATRLMPDIHWIPGLCWIDGYEKIRRSIFERFDVQEGENYLEFAYDWRRTNRASAEQLRRTVEPLLHARRQKTGNPNARLVLIGHSMGGLVARWYLEKLDGWRSTRSLITFGTPYRGSVRAVESLYGGLKKKLGPFTLLDLAAPLRSFASVYELLPIYPCVDLGDGPLERLNETKIPNIDPTRVGEALRFHRAIRDAVADHQDDPHYTLEGYRIHPVTGIEQPTAQSVRVRQNDVEILYTWNGRDLSGDGTVPRVSAVPLEVGDAQTGMFAGEKHGSLQNDDAVLRHVRGILTGQNIDLSTFERVEPTRIGLDVDELFTRDEPIPVVAHADYEDLELDVRATNVDTGEVAASALLSSTGDRTYRAVLGPLPEGCYRVRVRGSIDSVTTLVSVLGEPR